MKGRETSLPSTWITSWGTRLGSPPRSHPQLPYIIHPVPDCETRPNGGEVSIKFSNYLNLFQGETFNILCAERSSVSDNFTWYKRRMTSVPREHSYGLLSARKRRSPNKVGKGGHWEAVMPTRREFPPKFWILTTPMKWGQCLMRASAASGPIPRKSSVHPRMKINCALPISRLTHHSRRIRNHTLPGNPFRRSPWPSWVMPHITRYDPKSGIQAKKKTQNIPKVHS